jgi:hypothetical protein
MDPFMTESDNPTGNAGSASVPTLESFTQGMAAEKLAILLDMEPSRKGDNPKEKAQEEPEAQAEGEDAETPVDAPNEAEETEETEPQDDEETEEGASALSDETEIDLGDGTRTTLADLKAAKKQVKEFQRDYTRKTEAVAQDRKTVEEKATLILERAQQLQQEREAFLSVVNQFLPPPQRPNVSPNEDPMAWISYNAEKENYDAALGQLHQVHEANEAQRQRQQQEMAEQMPQVLDAQRVRLFELKPQLKNPEVAKKVQSEILEYLPKAYGWTPEQINQIYAADMVAAMVDLVEYQKIKASAPAAKAKVETKPPLVKPEKRKAPVKGNTRQDLHDRLRKTGRRDDAVAILKALDF